MNGTQILNPDFTVFEEELKKSPPKIQNIIGKLLSKKTPKAPIKVNKEHHSPDQVQNLIKYNEVLTYFGGKIPENLKETWENLNKRPNITQEEYQKLKEGGTKPADYDQVKGDLSKWTTIFPNLDPKIVREKYDALPSVELSEANKEAIREYASLKGKVEELEKRPIPEVLNQAVQTEKDKYKDYDENKKKLTDWQEAFPNLDPKQVKEQQSKETKPADYDSTKEQLKKWTDAFPNSDAEFTGKDPNVIKDNYLKYKNQGGEQKPKEPTNEDKDLGIEDDNPESISKRKLISEIRRLTSLFSEKELSYRKIEVHFTNDKSKLSPTNDGNIYLLLDQKDKLGKWNDKLVLWDFIKELTHTYIIIKNKEEYNKEFNLRFSPLFWKHFLYEDKSVVKWVNENVNSDYKGLILIEKPSTFPNETFNLSEILPLYFYNSNFDKFYKELTGKEVEKKDLVEEKTITTSQWIDESWLVIGKKITDLIGQELAKGISKEESIKLWTGVEIGYDLDSGEYILKINYHKENPHQEQIEQLVAVPLKLELEYLKKEQKELPNQENFTKLIRQKSEWKNYLHDLTSEDEYKEIINKIEKIN